MTFDYPTIYEIAALDANAEKYEKGKVPQNQWNGEHYRSFFEDVVTPRAEQDEVDPWDIFAVFMTKFRGTTFDYGEENDTLTIHFE